MAIATFRRYEKKYLLTLTQYQTLLPSLEKHMGLDSYCENGEDYEIYSLYYDTKHHDLIRHSLSHPYYKEKLRVRSYRIPRSQQEPVFVELKKKIGGVTAKRRVELPLGEAYRLLAGGALPVMPDYLSREVLREISCFLTLYAVRPAAYISYKRLAFTGKEDPTLRVTFDREICTRREQLLLEAGSFGGLLIPEDQRLMEIKTLGTLPLWLVRELSALEIYSRGFSKYGTEYQQWLRAAPCDAAQVPSGENGFLDISHLFELRKGRF